MSEHNFKQYLEKLLGEKIEEARNEDQTEGKDIMGQPAESSRQALWGKEGESPHSATDAPGLSRKEIIGNAFTMLVAGHETTNSTLYIIHPAGARDGTAAAAERPRWNPAPDPRLRHPRVIRTTTTTGTAKPLITPLLSSTVGRRLQPRTRRCASKEPPAATAIPNIFAVVAAQGSGGAAQVLTVDGGGRPRKRGRSGGHGEASAGGDIPGGAASTARGR